MDEIEKRVPDDCAVLLAMAEAAYTSGEHLEAALWCRKLLRQNPKSAEAHFMLGTIHYLAGNWPAAVQHYDDAFRFQPEAGFLQINQALALKECGAYDDALHCYASALVIDGPSVRLYYNRGILLQKMGLLDEARQDFEHALALDPGHINSWVNFSAVCLTLNDDLAALHSCHHGLYQDPCHPALLGNLATAYGKLFRFEESIFWNRRLLEQVQGAERAEVLGRIANLLADSGRVDEAISYFDEAIVTSCDPYQRRALASTRLFVLHYSSCWSTAAIATEHWAWGEAYFPPVGGRSFANNTDPERPIRIAYLSPDFKIHAVVFFLQPVLAAHNPAQVTVFCYADVAKPDVVTRQLKEEHNVIWRDVAQLDDAAVERQLQEDGIDILVDLAGHTAGNRLPLFARRAVPLQLTWIGYPNGTGLKEMDYRISDALADPPGITDCFHTEKLLRMPDSFLCYRPGGDFPEVAPPPCMETGYTTFGSFSNFKKVTIAQLELWASIMAAVPDSRLVFRARGMTQERFRREIAPIFNVHHVAPERVVVLGHARSVVENLEDYSRIDIALDTFPYHGTTTTCEALCMGVPVVTLSGDSHVSRVGVSLLTSVGLADLIASSACRYRECAVKLAGDPVRREILRSSLREQMLDSPLGNNVHFTRNLEHLYRQIWRQWCYQQQN